MHAPQPRTQRKLGGQLAAFALVGLAATAVHYLAALSASWLVPVAWANPVGFVVAFLVSYFGHTHLTFQLAEPDRRHRRRLPKFLLTALLGFAIGQAILLTLTRLTALPDWLALAIAVGSVPAITFVISRLWVFR